MRIYCSEACVSIKQNAMATLFPYLHAASQAILARAEEKLRTPQNADAQETVLVDAFRKGADWMTPMGGDFLFDFLNLARTDSVKPRVVERMIKEARTMDAVRKMMRGKNLFSLDCDRGIKVAISVGRKDSTRCRLFSVLREVIGSLQGEEKTAEFNAADIICLMTTAKGMKECIKLLLMPSRYYLHPLNEDILMAEMRNRMHNKTLGPTEEFNIFDLMSNCFAKLGRGGAAAAGTVRLVKWTPELSGRTDRPDDPILVTDAAPVPAPGSAPRPPPPPGTEWVISSPHSAESSSRPSAPMIKEVVDLTSGKEEGVEPHAADKEEEATHIPECAICLYGPPTVMFLPCRHMALCDECAGAGGRMAWIPVKKDVLCPLCRQGIAECVKPILP